MKRFFVGLALFSVPTMAFASEIGQAVSDVCAGCPCC